MVNVPLQVLIDSGASINVIDEKAYHAIIKSPQNNRLSLRHTSMKIYSYGGTSPLPVLGTFYTRIESKTHTTPATIYVIKGENGCLLSYKTATELELVSVIAQTNASVNTTTPLSTLSSTQFRSEYSDLFDGIGKMDFQVHLHIDPSVPPRHNLREFCSTFAKSSIPNLTNLNARVLSNRLMAQLLGCPSRCDTKTEEP
ncbi:Retrovirus-related Pol poly from transposon 412 [Paramuricea clavata]|uniref:Retrovirus-related Pol poly from transposon 412 n=1 Tax=Paramuricea clavata TaxID=317549 RepID=A0A6S7GZW3_PARCT|nr:Retrovirus-related Pol poly from transposon 412 [Paramuricea clavata]